MRALRAQRSLSQAELGAAMRVSRQTINSIETGHYTPSLPLAIALARFFGKPVEEVFHLPTGSLHTIWRSRWFTPAFSVLLGLAMLAARAAGGDCCTWPDGRTQPLYERQSAATVLSSHRRS